LVYQVLFPLKDIGLVPVPKFYIKPKQKSHNHIISSTRAAIRDLEKIQWNQKELREQELVSEHIRRVLNNYVKDYITEIGPKTYNVGKLVHLRTVFQFDSQWVSTCLGRFLSELHPTQAVCGLPVDQSRKLINQVEGYDREYYTGFLGSVSAQNNTCLYVNLRCLQAFNNGIALYAGGGITAESLPSRKNEWQLKIQSLLQIIEKVNIQK
jgi:isochorismate synthase